MPMAISFVGAGIIWRFVYEYRSDGARADRPAQRRSSSRLGGEPVQWMQTDPINTILLIVVMIWIQTGFAMVILSRGHQGHPDRADRGGAARRHQRLAAVPQRDDPRHPRAARRRAHDDLDRDPQGLRHRAHDDRRKLQHQRHRERDVHAGVPGERDRAGLGARASSCSCSCCRSSSTTSTSCASRGRSDEQRRPRRPPRSARNRRATVDVAESRSRAPRPGG